MNASEIEAAFALQQFRVFYQPIFGLRDRKIRKAEALVRWEHPSLGLLSPGRFLRDVQEHGCMGRLSLWVLSIAQRQVVSWMTATGSKFQISVNWSPAQFGDLENHAASLSIIRACGEVRGIVIEITEEALLRDDPQVRQQLEDFRGEGIRIALDDFGIGYAALSYLRSFRPDVLKIDQSFIRDIVDCEYDRALTDSIIYLAHRLGVEVVAEGVETQAQQTILESLNCDYAQGYFYSEPIPADQFDVILRK
jgi:EAL domain-containing protein (putative c-di-GMP-specific phosphodiesterase class I)